MPNYIIRLIALILCLFVHSTNTKANNAKDSASQAITAISKAYTIGNIPENKYLDSIRETMKSILSANILFTNKELLDLLTTYRITIWNNTKNEEHKRTYYGILSNQAQMNNRDGEMLYYAEKLNETEKGKSNQPSFSALTIIAIYYNSKKAYTKTQDTYSKYSHFIAMHSESLLKDSKIKMPDLVQFCMMLYRFSESAYNLKDTVLGNEMLDKLVALERIATNKFPNDFNALSNIRYVRILTQYEKGLAINSRKLIAEALYNIEEMLQDETVPTYFKGFMEFMYTDNKIVFFINEKNADSVAYYLNILDNINQNKDEGYSAYMIKKYKSILLYLQGHYKESIDTLISSVIILENYKTSIVQDINELMYVQAKADESQWLLTEAEITRKKTEKKLLMSGIIITILLFSSIFTIQLIRKKQKLKFLEFKLNLARNIHDETNPALLYAKALVKSTSADGKHDKYELEQHINNTMEIIRSLSHDLKSNKLHTLDNLTEYIELQLKKLNVNDTFTYNITKEIEPKTFISYYQYQQFKAILEECITNSIKHAEFNEIKILFIQKNKSFSIKYADNGKGWDNHTIEYGMGIKNIEERVINLNGKLLINNAYPNGYNIEIKTMLR